MNVAGGWCQLTKVYGKSPCSQARLQYCGVLRWPCWHAWNPCWSWFVVNIVWASLTSHTVVWIGV